MILCRVVGNAVATVKHPDFERYTVLVCQPVDPEGRPVGVSFLSVDSVQAGVGDLVLCAREGNTARQILAGGRDSPHHSVVLAVVDEVRTGGSVLAGPGR